MGVAASLLLGILASFPVSADTSSELSAERDRLARVQAELDRLAVLHSEAETRYALTEAKLDRAQLRVERVRAQMRSIQNLVAERARAAYQSGGAGTIELLLTSDTFGQFSDRVEFLGQVAQGDADLLAQAQVVRERLRRYERDLTELSRQQEATLRALADQKTAIAAKLAEAQAAVEALQRRLERERAAAAARAAAARRAAAAAAAAAAEPAVSTTTDTSEAPTTFTGGALQACPVGQPHSFTNDFGAPRSGGRTHQGIDLIAPYGTPIYAAQSGSFSPNYNSLGGIGGIVTAGNGDYTYYTHMSSLSGASGSVSAGTVIGYVGTSGNASGGPPHLHFEYHPGGGGAVNPYQMLLSVC